MSAAEVVAQLAGLEIDSDSCKNMSEYKKNHNFFNKIRKWNAAGM